MIVGLGTDIVELSRIADSYERLGARFAARILTPNELLEFEQTQHRVAFLGKRFSIKEAAVKALGTGIGRGISWQHMEVGHDELGAPLLIFSGAAAEVMSSRGGVRAWVSVADERHYATATVVIEA